MKTWLKQVLCRHRWKHVIDVWVTTPKGEYFEELLKCEKCGKLLQREKR